jgi:mannose-6-phosphate isomerase-like protein (cupin superfamily)
MSARTVSPTVSESSTLPRFVRTVPPVLVNRVTGDRAVFLGPTENDPRTFRFRFTLPAGGHGAPPHRHSTLIETFEVESGRLNFTDGALRNRRELDAGEAVTVPAGRVHAFANPFDAPVTFVSTVTPGATFERFIRGMYDAANRGETDARGLPRDLLATALLLEYADFFVPFVPMGLQRMVRGTLAAFARATGRER